MQRHLLFRALLERVAQQITQPRDHAPHTTWIALHERGDRVERVEEKVWIELRAQHVEPSLRELCLQPRGFLETRAITQEVVARDAGSQYGEVHHQVVHEA